MAFSVSFIASSGMHRTMLEREVTPLGEPNSFERIESLLSEGKSYENTLSLPPNEPPLAPSNIPATLAVPRKRKIANPRVVDPKPNASSKRVNLTPSLIVNIHGCRTRSRSTFLSLPLGNR